MTYFSNTPTGRPCLNCGKELTTNTGYSFNCSNCGCGSYLRELDPLIKKFSEKEKQTNLFIEVMQF